VSKSNLSRRIVLACFGAVIGLTVGELIVRTVNVAPAIKSMPVADEDCVYQRSANPLLGFELKPGYKNESPNFIDSFERTNSHGQRDVERTLEKKDGTRRILMLGDSVVEGYGLPFADTIPQQLQSLYDQSNESVEVLNFGVSAYCTLAEIELLETKGLQFSPDVVVLVFVENDFDNFNREAFPLGESIQRPALAKVLFKSSHLFRLVCLNLNLFQFRQSDPVKWNKEAIGDNNVTAGLKRFRELADQHQFEPLIVVWPRFTNHEVVDPLPIPGSEHLIVEALAQQFRIPTQRLSPTFRDAAKSASSTRLEFSQGDELHPNSFGVQIAAQAICDGLSKDFSRNGVSPEVSLAIVEDAISQLPRNEPNYARVLNRIGNKLLAEGKPTEAIVEYEKALLEDPANAVTHNNLGIALQRIESDDKAEEHYARAVEIDAKFAEAYFNLASLLDEKNDARESAQKHFIQAVQLQPEFVAAHFGLSRSLFRSARLTAAEAGFRQVLKLDPDHHEAMRSLVQLLLKKEKYAEAKKWLERQVSIDPNDAESLNNLGAVCVALGDMSSARSFFQAAIASDPNHPSAAKNLAKLGAAL